MFDIAGQLVSVPITSICKLEWGSLRVNFFVIINPAAMKDMPQTWITVFHLPDAKAAVGNLLTRDYPNLTVVDIGSVLKQIQGVVDQVIAAVEFLFLFTLTAGVLVLYAALVGTQDEQPVCWLPPVWQSSFGRWRITCSTLNGVSVLCFGSLVR